MELLTPSLFRTVSALAGATFLAACASTTRLVDTKVEPGVSPAPLRKVAALALAKDAQVGRTAERTFVEKMGGVAKQSKAIPFFSVVPGEDRRDHERVKALLAAAGVDGVVVFRVLEKDEVTLVNDSTISKQAWNNFLWAAWGPWYGPGTGIYWGADLNSASVKRNYALIEAALYTVADARLVWTARTKSVNADSVEDVLEAVSAEVARSLRSARFVD